MAKKVSAYVKGDRFTPEYYRIYQYLDHIDGTDTTYHMMLSHWTYKHLMPISKQAFAKKLLAYLLIYIRMLTALVSDNIRRPDIIVVHKRIIPHFMPPSFRWLLHRLVKKGCKLLWDFDDQILETREISRRTFNEMALWATHIIVTHDYLADMIPKDLRHKVSILPTTDGELFFLSHDIRVKEERLQSIRSEVRLLWLGTSLNLHFIEIILPQLEDAAQTLKQQGRRLSLHVVCNEPLRTKSQHLSIVNVKWTREDAIREIRQAHIGIMPLADTTFTRGKGGLKLVQYLSASLPCIASEVGYNRVIVDESCGHLIPIETPEEWTCAIIHLSEPNAWMQASIGAFRQWLVHFPYEENLRQWKGFMGLYTS